MSHCVWSTTRRQAGKFLPSAARRPNRSNRSNDERHPDAPPLRLFLIAEKRHDIVDCHFASLPVIAVRITGVVGLGRYFRS